MPPKKKPKDAGQSSPRSAGTQPGVMVRLPETFRAELVRRKQVTGRPVAVDVSMALKAWFVADPVPAAK